MESLQTPAVPRGEPLVFARIEEIAEVGAKGLGHSDQEPEAGVDFPSFEPLNVPHGTADGASQPLLTHARLAAQLPHVLA